MNRVRSSVRYELIGNIASGKTTLAKILSTSINGAFEAFQDNPFWKSFYESPALYAFETEITFTLQHYHSIKRSKLAESDFVCDFSLNLDLAYADVTLQGEHHNLYCKLLSELRQELGEPEVLLHLKCPEEVLMKRIRARGRETENSITVDYLKLLSSSIQQNLALVESSSRIIEIDSEQLDFAHDEHCAQNLRETIFAS